VSSTVLLAEPGTRGTFLALRFLAAGLRAGERVVLVSTREDRDAIRRICQRESVLAPTCLGDDGGFHPDFRVLYLHPEFISPGKFTWDILRLVQGGHGNQGDRPVSRLVFDNVFRLQDRFPLLEEQKFLITALLDMLRYHQVTPLFVDMTPPGAGSGRATFDPSSHLVSYDNVIQLMAAEGEQGTPRFRVLKSVGNDFLMTPQPIDWRKD
jgi:hypothetical protein